MTQQVHTWGTGYGDRKHIVGSFVEQTGSGRNYQHGYGRALCSPNIVLDYVQGIYEISGFEPDVLDKRKECSRCVKKAAKQ